jgi:hypothetical protein
MKFDNVKDSFYKELECVFNKFPKYHLKMLLDFIAKVGREDRDRDRDRDREDSWK